MDSDDRGANGEDGFAADFFSALLRDMQAAVPGVGELSHDLHAVREPWRQTPRTRVRDVGLRAVRALGLSRHRFDPGQAGARLARIASQLAGLQETHELLADQRSRSVLLSVLRFRVLGPGHVPLPTPRREFWQACQRVERSHRVATGVLDTPFDKALDLYELPGRSAPIRYFGPAHEIVEFFELEQYAYEHGGVRIAASPGDTVVDGGGGWAETALYFADAVGAEGRVFCFEFVPENLVILERNLAENPELRERIELIPKPLWSTSRQPLSYDPAGPVTSVGGSSGERAATSETIDRLRASRGLARIDFIKLDVEGAELEVLRGAEETLRSCRPRLAVAVYHRIEDLVEIPRFLSALGYELFLDHVAAGPYETVLFARPL